MNPTPALPPGLEAQALTLAYGEERIVEALGLTFEPGTITTLVGPNGCGKSTLLRALARLHRPRAGAVLLDGQDLHHRPTREVAQRLGYLAQHASVPDGLTVADLVARGRFPHRQAWEPPTAADRAAVDRALALCGLGDLADRPVDELSGGQRQRAWIALTLAQETPLVLLDEPTTFLDPAHQTEVLDLVVRLHETEGRTFVLVLHDLDQARRISHRVVALRGGQVRADGAPADVLTQALLEDLFGVPFDAQGPVPAVDLGRPRAPGTAPRLEARGLVVGYGPRPVLGPLDLDLGPGGLTALVGPNGCGKSTLLRALAGLHPRLAGTVSLDGRPLDRWGPRGLAQRRAWVRQDTPLPAGFTVRELLGLGAYPRAGFRKGGAGTALEGALRALDLGAWVDRPLEHLSGGQRQRAWLALALVQGSPLLLLDEPTSFLDPRHQRDLLDALWTLTRDGPTTVVAILHEPALARRYADRIVDLGAGLDSKGN